MENNKKVSRRNFIKTSGVAATVGSVLGGSSVKAASSSATSPSSFKKRPHIIFIMADQMRGDCIGAVNDKIITPNIDSIVKNGLCFKNGYTSAPSCTPARAGLLTGLSPWNHGMLGYAQVARRYKYEMPRMLRESGYYTYGIGKMHWSPQRCLHGFHGVILDESGRVESDGYQSDYRIWFQRHAPGVDPDITGIGWNENRASTFKLDENLHPTAWTGDMAVEFIDNYKQENPLFLKVSFERPHSPYDPPKRCLDMYKNVDIPKPFVGDWADKFGKMKHIPDPAFGDFGEEFAVNSRKHYYAGITFIDEQVGRVIDSLKRNGLYEDSIIIFTADHGDMLGDHHHWRKTYAYEGSAKIPFVMQCPEWINLSKEKGSFVSNPVELRDFLPTFLDAAKADKPKDLDGKSLFDLACGNGDGWREYIDMEHATAYSQENYWCGLTDGKQKYIWFFRTGEEQLFDLEKDPKEENELSQNRKYKKDLTLWRDRMIKHLEERGEGFVKDGELVKRDKTLLYGPNYPKDTMTEREKVQYWQKESQVYL